MSPRTDLLVLSYHAVSDSWPTDLAISVQRLTWQLEFLVRRGYQGATFSEAVIDPPSSRTLVVTFDDAYRSTFTKAKPVFDRLGLPGTVFVPTAFPGSHGPLCWPGIDVWKGGPYENELTPMSWCELSTLASCGWEIGSHTMTHPRLTQLDDETLAAELAESRQACTDAFGSCRSLAYPYGDVDGRVVQATRFAGYEVAADLPDRLHPPRPLEWPRIGAYEIDTFARFAIKVSPSVRRIRVWLGL